MMNFLNTIPENVGWVMVGATGMLCAIALVMLGKCIFDIIVERIMWEDEENEG